MEINFTAKGHRNITSCHENTFEFTKEKEVTKEGHCIVGAESNFDLKELKKLKGKIKIAIKADNESEIIIAEKNPDFNDDKEIVIRKSSFSSPRTFAVNADKSSDDFNKELKQSFSNPSTIIKVIIEEI